ncbi:MAG: trigger factor family protein, partial [Bacteroidales bacterium]
MNVSEKSTGNVSAEIIVKIVKADYQDGVDKALRSYRQKANIPGFRKGMVPMGMINKMVGKSVLIEEINKLVSEQLYNYIRDKKMGVLGEPLPAEEQKDIDFDTQEDFEFKFDIALAPEINLDLSKKDKIDYDDIIVDSDMIQKQVDAFCNRFGKQDEAEIVNEKDIVKGKFTELNADGTPKDGGIVVETGMVSPNYIKSEEDKKKFIGANKGSKVVFNPAASCGGNDTELASMLHIKKEEAAAVKSDFEVEISSILSFKPAEVNQELFDNAFGKDTVKDEAEFKSRVSAMISDQIAPEADYKFAIDVRKYVETKVGDMVFADEILKRWLKFNDTENKLQSVDEEYKKMLPDLKWQLI